MKSIVVLFALGLYLQSASAKTGCAGAEDSLGLHLLSNLPVVGRRLLATWRPCKEQKNTRFVGEYIKKILDVESYRHCCVECKNTRGCVTWSFNIKSGSCKVFGDSDTLEQRDDEGHIGGTLDWRINELFGGETNDGTVDIYPTPPSDDLENPLEDNNSDTNGYDEPDNSDSDPYSDAPEAPEDSSYDEDSDNNVDSPTPSGPVPTSGDMLKNKVLYGRRLNSYLPCRGNVAATPKDCASQCSSDGECEAWTFAGDINCSWLGESQPQGLCYLMADVDKKNAFDAPDGETFVSGWA